jgi:prephenate dehydrogenase
VVDRDDADPAAAVADVAITFVATPPEVIPAVIDRLIEGGYPGVVCDIASLKHHLQPAVSRARAAGLSITSIHPMFGPAVRTLSDRVICICDCGDRAATERVTSLFSGTAATLVPLDFEGHDRIVSYVLGLSHLINLLFAKVLSAGSMRFEDIDRVGSTTFRSQVETTETVIREDPDLYFGIQALNPFTPDLYDDLRREFEELARWIESGDRESFTAMMERSVRWLAG